MGQEGKKSPNSLCEWHWVINLQQGFALLSDIWVTHRLCVYAWVCICVWVVWLALPQASSIMSPSSFDVPRFFFPLPFLSSSYFLFPACCAPRCPFSLLFLVFSKWIISRMCAWQPVANGKMICINDVYTTYIALGPAWSFFFFFFFLSVF